MVHAFHYFGGVTECILTDRMKTVLIEETAGELRFHKKFLEFAAYADFSFAFAGCELQIEGDESMDHIIS
jgi:transposase